MIYTSTQFPPPYEFGMPVNGPLNMQRSLTAFAADVRCHFRLNACAST